MIPSRKIYDGVFAADYAHLHNFGMKVEIPQLLKSMMDALDGNQTDLAKRLTQKGATGLKVTQPQISRWIKGQQPERPNFDRIVAVARELHVINDMRSEDIAAGLPEPPRKPTVRLKGYVGAGGEAHYYSLSDDDDYEEVPAPIDSNDQTVAVEIKGKSLGPLLESWLVYYDDVRSPITADLYGSLCVIGLSDDRILIKKIKHEPDGSLTLVSNGTEPDILDAQVEWAAKVTDMKPR